MTTVIDVPVAEIPPLHHDEAAALAETEYARLLALAGDLSPQEWLRPTDCTAWTVRDVVGHLLGMAKMQVESAELLRQIGTATERARESGELRLTELTALQVREHAHLTTAELLAALHETVPRVLAGRRALSAERRAAPYDPQLPGEPEWTLGYLFDSVLLRDPWLHRIDICRAVGRRTFLTSGHDGRIIADVVADWAGRHGRPFTLELTGPAGGRFRVGHGGVDLRVDAVEFCRTLSGRASQDGLLRTWVPF
jgi:uncharacterized protein (TIGR03083 family)